MKLKSEPPAGTGGVCEASDNNGILNRRGDYCQVSNPRHRRSDLRHYPEIEGRLAEFRVNRNSPCPVCGRPDWCLSDGVTFAICQRVQSGKEWGAAGWFHDLRRPGERGDKTRRRPLPLAARSTPKGDAPPPALKLASAEGAAAVYVYCDEHGRLLYRKVRFYDRNGKKTTPYHAWRDGQWWSGPGCMNEVRRLLYHLPRILDASTIWICEGERCVDAMTDFGFRACCTDGGCNPASWRPEFTELMRGRQVNILPDNDEKGLRYAEHVARAIYPVARRVKKIPLPGLGLAEDVADFIARGGLES